ncbi:hypothetical protein U2F10_24050 [Leptothoe sp. EHU-05/26/07-4]
MTPATPVNPSPEAPSINIPVNSDQSQSQAQLRSFLMALVHSYGLTAVLEALNEGMFGHFDNTLEENDISTPILEALGTAHTVSKYVMNDQG